MYKIWYCKWAGTGEGIIQIAWGSERVVEKNKID